MQGLKILGSQWGQNVPRKPFPSGVAASAEGVVLRLPARCILCAGVEKILGRYFAIPQGGANETGGGVYPLGLCGSFSAR